jgi:hypothetical protein
MSTVTDLVDPEVLTPITTVVAEAPGAVDERLLAQPN